MSEDQPRPTPKDAADYVADQEMPKVLEERAEASAPDRTIKLLDKLNAGEIFACEDTERKFIANLDFNTFKNLLFAVNSSLRAIPLKERKADGESVYVLDHIPARFEDKEKLLQETFEALKRMNSEGRSQEDLAILVSVSINALHMFDDANGRTSRLSYYLLSRDHPNYETEKPLIKKLATESEGRKLLDVNTFSTGRDINSRIIKDYLEMDPHDSMTPTMATDDSEDKDYRLASVKAFGEKVSEFDYEDFELLNDIVLSREIYAARHGIIAFVKYLQSKATLSNFLKIHTYEEGDTSASLKVADVIRSLDRKSAKELCDTYWDIKRIFMKYLIESIENPESHTFPEEEGHPKRTLLDYMKDDIQHSNHLPEAKKME